MPQLSYTASDEAFENGFDVFFPIEPGFAFDASLVNPSTSTFFQPDIPGESPLEELLAPSFDASISLVDSQSAASPLPEQVLQITRLPTPSRNGFVSFITPSSPTFVQPAISGESPLEAQWASSFHASNSLVDSQSASHSLLEQVSPAPYFPSPGRDPFDMQYTSYSLGIGLGSTEPDGQNASIDRAASACNPLCWGQYSQISPQPERRHDYLAAGSWQEQELGNFPTFWVAPSFGSPGFLCVSDHTPSLTSAASQSTLPMPTPESYSGASQSLTSSPRIPPSISTTSRGSRSRSLSVSGTPDSGAIAQYEGEPTESSLPYHNERSLARSEGLPKTGSSSRYILRS